MIESHIDLALKAWLKSNPEFQPIDHYPGRDLLLPFEKPIDRARLGFCRGDSGSLIDDDASRHALDGSEETWGKLEPTRFCGIPSEAAI